MSFDGDSKKADRKVVKDRARIILTNPDMLHYTLLPQHDSYARVLRNCKYVVIDEAHVYKGAFGAHTTCVLRRFVRICLAYGSSPQFICCSATIGNPLQHFEELVPVNFLPQKIDLKEILTTIEEKERMLLVQLTMRNIDMVLVDQGILVLLPP